jgi:hypothetical protein
MNIMQDKGPNDLELIIEKLKTLRLYKSTLTDKEYREMMNTVVKTSKTIKPFVIKTLH